MKKNIIILLLFIVTAQFSNAQKDVTLTVIGQGVTKEKARLNAFRNAIERTYGAFISSNTEILNDELIKDEIITVSSGNIKKFDILSEIQLPSGEYTMTIKATVSVQKLISFCESKGINVEFKGGLFAQNIKLQKLNEENEVAVIKNLIKQGNTILNKAFDYELAVGDPLQTKGNKWEIFFKVSIQTNQNFESIAPILQNTLTGLKMSTEEIDNYYSVNKKTYKFFIFKNLSNLYTEKSEILKEIDLYQQILIYCKNKKGKGYAVKNKNGEIGEEQGRKLAFKNKEQFDNWWFKNPQSGGDRIRNMSKDSIKYFTQKYKPKKIERFQEIVLRSDKSISLLDNFLHKVEQTSFSDFVINQVNTDNNNISRVKLNYRYHIDEEHLLTLGEKKPHLFEDTKGNRWTEYEIGESCKSSKGMMLVKAYTKKPYAINLAVYKKDTVVGNISYKIYFSLDELETISSFNIKPRYQ